MTRSCAECGGPLSQRANECASRFAKRKYCKVSCAAKTGSRKAAQINTARDESELKTIRRNGYEMRWVRGRAQVRGKSLRGGGVYVYTHRLVMEKALGRQLKSKEIVHHINGNQLDNDLSNLKILADQSSHAREHVKNGKGWGRPPGPRPDLRWAIRIQYWDRCAFCKKWWARARRNAKCCSVSCANRARRSA